MRVLVCVKRVPLTGDRMVLTPDNRALETKHLGFTISPHEECAIEEAVRLVESNGGESVALTLGPEDAEEQLREAMAMGVNRGILLKTDGEEWDPQATAAAIADAVRAEEIFDLILFGNDSSDSGNYQVGIRFAHALGLPVVAGVKKIELQEGQVRCEQQAGGSRDVYVTPLPVVLTVLEGLNLPRYPSVPSHLRAKSKPLTVFEPTREAARLEMMRLIVPQGQGKRVAILGRGAEAAPKVVEVLRQLGAAR